MLSARSVCPAAKLEAFTPLIRAAYGPHPEVLAILLEAGADPNVKNHGMTALDYAELGKVEGRTSASNGE